MFVTEDCIVVAAVTVVTNPYQGCKDLHWDHKGIINCHSLSVFWRCAQNLWAWGMVASAGGQFVSAKRKYLNTVVMW